MKKFSEFITESEEEKVDEGFGGGLLAAIGGIFTGLAGLGMANPLVASAGAGMIVMGFMEAWESQETYTKENESAIANWIKRKYKKYQDKKFLETITEEKAKSILDEVEKRKAQLKGPYKGAVTKLQNELDRAFKAGDDAKIGKILKKFIADNQK